MIWSSFSKNKHKTYDKPDETLWKEENRIGNTFAIIFNAYKLTNENSFSMNNEQHSSKNKQNK